MEVCETKNKTDKAFIEFLYRFKSPISIQKDKYLKNEGSYKQFPFDSKKKRMTTFIKNKDFPTGYRLFSKGGGENARKFCKYYIDPDTGDKKVLDDSISIQIKQAIEKLFNVKVVSVNIMNTHPKDRRVGKYSGKTNRYKKAIVKLASGSTISFD